MNRKEIYALIDCETANDIDCPLPYNIAVAFIDQHGNKYEKGNFINRDIFFDRPELMETAYYAEKIPLYLEQIQSGEIDVATLYEIKKWFNDKCREYNAKAIIAHNARFDYKACNTVQRYETCSKYRYFFPYGVEIWDTLAMARDVIVPKASYRKFCEENGYLCKNGTPRATAEILYRFITNDINFEEEHRAMEDVDIECEIFWYCINQHKKMRRKAFKDKE